jgi:hypothetical protein
MLVIVLFFIVGKKLGIKHLSMYSELKRRNVIKVAIAYVIVAWLVVHALNDFAIPLGMPIWAPAFFIVILGACFPIALVLSWVYEITPEGMKRSDSIEEPKSIVRKTGRSINRIIIVAVVLTVILHIMEWWGFFPHIL